eukprot:gb/GECG01001953.1/.p1 GENE.gb/GECG01001953.1/~~gb/GECG01001953.1/.p1  ORF type:complete len:1245 (+),score=161.18 gb/GECG01001953.1/:1-3735(+)
MSSSLAPNEANNGSNRGLTPNAHSYIASRHSDASGGAMSESEKAPKRQEHGGKPEGNERKTPPIFRRIPSDTKAFTIWIDPQLFKKSSMESSSSMNASEWRNKATSASGSRGGVLSGRASAVANRRQGRSMHGTWTKDDIDRLQQLHNAVMEQAAKQGAQLLQLGDRKGRFHEVAKPGTKWIRTSLGELLHVMIFDDESYQALLASSDENGKDDTASYVSHQHEKRDAKREDDCLSTEGAQSNASSLLASGPSQQANGSHSTDPNSGLIEKYGRSLTETTDGHKCGTGSQNVAKSNRLQAAQSEHRVSSGQAGRRALLKQEIAEIGQRKVLWPDSATPRTSSQLRSAWQLAAQKDIYVASLAGYWKYISARAQRMGLLASNEEKYASIRKNSKKSSSNPATSLPSNLPSSDVHSSVFDLSGWFYPVVHDYMRSKFERPNFPGLGSTYPMLHSLFPEVEKHPHCPFIPLAEVAFKKKKASTHRGKSQVPSGPPKDCTKSSKMSSRRKKSATSGPPTHTTGNVEPRASNKDKKEDTTESGLGKVSEVQYREISDSSRMEEKEVRDADEHAKVHMDANAAALKAKTPKRAHAQDDGVSIGTPRRCELCGQSFKDRKKHMLDPLHAQKVSELSFSSLKTYFSKHGWTPRYTPGDTFTAADNEQKHQHTMGFLRGALPIDPAVYVLSESGDQVDTLVKEPYACAYKRSSAEWAVLLETLSNWLSDGHAATEVRHSIDCMRRSCFRTSYEWIAEYSTEVRTENVPRNSAAESQGITASATTHDENEQFTYSNTASKVHTRLEEKPTTFQVSATAAEYNDRECMSDVQSATVNTRTQHSTLEHDPLRMGSHAFSGEHCTNFTGKSGLINGNEHVVDEATEESIGPPHGNAASEIQTHSNEKPNAPYQSTVDADTTTQALSRQGNASQEDDCVTDTAALSTIVNSQNLREGSVNKGHGLTGKEHHKETVDIVGSPQCSTARITSELAESFAQVFYAEDEPVPSQAANSANKRNATERLTRGHSKRQRTSETKPMEGLVHFDSGVRVSPQRTSSGAPKRRSTHPTLRSRRSRVIIYTEKTRDRADTKKSDTKSYTAVVSSPRLANKENSLPTDASGPCSSSNSSSPRTRSQCLEAQYGIGSDVSKSSEEVAPEAFRNNRSNVPPQRGKVVKSAAGPKCPRRSGSRENRTLKSRSAGMATSELQRLTTARKRRSSSGQTPSDPSGPVSKHQSTQGDPPTSRSGRELRSPKILHF